MDKAGWISVKDRLPEPNKQIGEYPYLVVEKYFAHPMKGWFFRWADGDQYWVVEGLNGHAHVTHWMPLPEMPND